METFNFLAGLSSVAGLAFAVATWAHDKMISKRKRRPEKKKSRIQWHWIRL